MNQETVKQEPADQSHAEQGAGQGAEAPEAKDQAKPATGEAAAPAGFEEFDLDDIEVIESKVFA